MIRHTALGGTSFSRSRALKLLIDAGKVTYAGNRKLKIYGTFSCSSGKRMKVDNRVFFTDEQEAISCGYRPCGHCMRKAYQKWKALN
ncbi:Ada metal-binding domain-containing protein [Mucilaginibacter aquariorum]|uniref:Metal-binding protein n=1 Tax=Mucilaginibacter aquariorum TaxID=2967225 RepID=A0ABT1T206_9SPHI|nr:Ada metal-binding domain-containing protein [Mucilaginibacter aquariorum]MCQ6958498.1 metal-binding protein [Mucilaginibacter aquariorum]